MRIDRIKFVAALARADLTTVKLAAKIGLSRGTISVVKSGKSCTEKTARKIAEGLGVSLEDLLLMEGSR